VCRGRGVVLFCATCCLFCGAVEFCWATCCGREKNGRAAACSRLASSGYVLLPLSLPLSSLTQKLSLSCFARLGSFYSVVTIVTVFLF